MELCENCAFRLTLGDGSFQCGISFKPVMSYQYGCLKWKDKKLYQEQLKEERLKKAKEIERKQKEYLDLQNRKANVLLTLMINSVQAAIMFLDQYESMVDFLGKDKDWAHEKRMALKQMVKSGKNIHFLFEHYFQPLILKAIKGATDEETAKKYDYNAEDVNELCQVIMLYADKCFENYENVQILYDCFNKLKGRGMFTQADFDKFILK